MADKDPEQLTGDALRLGTIASVDHAAATCTVESGDIVTGDLHWIALRAGGVRSWSPPTVGEQCLLICPEGDTEAGLVLVGIYCDAFPAPSAEPDIVATEYPDGAVISYDSAAHSLSAILPAGGTATVTAPGGLTFNADVTVNGKITATGDVTGSGISLKNHKHGGVQGGASQTGMPV